MLKAGIFILFIFCSLFCSGQSDSIVKSSGLHYNIKLSYNSTLIYPGLSTGIEFPLRTFHERETKKRLVVKERFVAGNVSFYHHPDFHNNLYLTIEWIMRRVNNKGFLYEYSIGPGCSRTFLQGTTYKVSENGDISVIKSPGYNYALVTTGGGFGYDFSVKKQLPFSTYAKMDLLIMFPYNSTFYLRPVLEIGIRFKPWNIINKSSNNHSITISSQK
ncbi:MAG: hypothetical protein EPN88_07990 [Bacteroidetes bacterium]|nr:MAG: hypothetical protein EPN88_07990 [Bacteroidota bacterium]